MTARSSNGQNLVEFFDRKPGTGRQMKIGGDKISLPAARIFSFLSWFELCMRKERTQQRTLIVVALLTSPQQTPILSYTQAFNMVMGP